MKRHNVQRGKDPLLTTVKLYRHDLFSRFAAWTTRFTGGRWGFLIATASIVIWAILGPFFDYSENWQLIINTGTTIVTFLMVFLIQNAQNRESRAIHLKLDEIIFSIKLASNEMIDIEHLPDDQLEVLAGHYHDIAMRLHPNLKHCETVRVSRANEVQG